MSEFKFAAVHTILIPTNQGPISRDEVIPAKTLDDAKAIAYSLHSQGAQNVAVIDLPEPQEIYRAKQETTEETNVHRGHPPGT